MSYEVDVLAVGQESKSGDAIAFRYGDFRQRDLFQVVVIDGGFQENGEQLVELIRGTYGTTSVDLVVSTHPDADHSSGLRVVLEELEVRELWMHLAWNHTAEANAYRGTVLKRFDEQLEKSLATANDLETIARRKNIPVREPFEWVRSRDASLVVLGPNEAYYNELVAQFESPENAALRMLPERLRTLLQKAAARLRELWDQEALVEPDPGATRPQNNSSAIILGQLAQDTRFLFTGDAGVPALDRAVPQGRVAWARQTLRYVQVPHHGSKRNLSPTVLDRLLGPKVPPATSAGLTAFISAAKDGEPDHPSKRVTNAAIRRGATVIATQGSSHFYKSSDRPMRPGYGPIDPITFTESYEED